MATLQAEVNRGLNCVEGLFPFQDHVRRRPADDAADAQARTARSTRTASSSRSPGTRPSTSWPHELKRVLKEKGPTALGMFGSGQWTIFEGYAATKLMRAGFRSNNLDPNARHCMASAAVAFMRTFGMDEPMGCYDDFENAEGCMVWGFQHGGDASDPVDPRRRPSSRPSDHVRVAVLSTFTHRSMDLADIPIIFKPGTDLVILNYIANHIIQTDRVNTAGFVEKHTKFRPAA